MSCELLAVPTSPCSSPGPPSCNIGALDFVRGVHLTCNDPRFGGISGLTNANSSLLVAVTDRGNWFELPLRPATGTRIRVGALNGSQSVSRLDAEAITRDSSSKVWYLSLERSSAESSVLAYAGSRPGGTYATSVALGSLEESLCGPQPPVPSRACRYRNFKFESLELLDDSRVLAICECNGNGLIFDMATQLETRRFVYPTLGGLQPSDVTRLRHGLGGILVLERFDNEQGGRGRHMHIRVTYLSDAQLLHGDGGVLRPTTLLELLPGQHEADNFEGLAAVETREGAHVFLISDDNFSPRQRTLLYEFWLPWTALDDMVRPALPEASSARPELILEKALFSRWRFGAALPLLAVSIVSLLRRAISARARTTSKGDCNRSSRELC